MNLPPVYSTFFESTIDIKNSPVSVEYLFWSHRKNLFLFVWNMYTCEIRDTNFKVLTWFLAVDQSLLFDWNLW